MGFPTCNTNQNRKEEAKGQQAIYRTRHKNWFVIVFFFLLVYRKGFRADARGEEANVKHCNIQKSKRPVIIYHLVDSFSNVVKFSV